MSFTKRHPLIVFYLLAFLLSWIVWGSVMAQARGLLGWHIPGNLAFTAVAIAAYLTAWLAGGWPAVRDLLSRLVRWRTSPLWYAVALLLLLLLSYLAIAVFALVRPGVPARIGVDISLPAALLYFVTNLPNMWLTEETAWRGFALPRLQRKYTALSASLIVGLLWGFWHLPLFLTPGTFQSSISFGGFLLSAVATAVLTSWIFNHAHGSVLLAAIFHSAVDASISYTGVMSSTAGLFWLFVALLCLAAGVVVVVEGPARLARHQPNDGMEYPTPASPPLPARDAG
jgi:uncharacterized protein